MLRPELTIYDLVFWVWFILGMLVFGWYEHRKNKQKQLRLKSNRIVVKRYKNKYRF